ncbi:alpha/beta fold hydrolase [Blattabacterium cuenoti]|uniref:alpha/beta fold hydrolase n=1 Tax=Blattabacterium cuenoti TaxID=1653831 RepID=UPI00163C9CB1|nr:alpha/beta fold hydrolase [Blattabacterium cuenoti]
MILYSKILGSGSPVLVLHGLFGNGDNWNFFARKYSNYYQIHLLDIRNHGKSPFSEKMSLDIMSEDILNYINYYKLQNPILLGHSIGGKIIMKFSVKFPYIPKKIIVVDISPIYHKNNNNKELISILKKVDFDIIKTRKDLDAFLKLYISDVRTRLFISKSTGKKENGKLYFKFFLFGIDNNYDDIIYEEIKKGTYNGPTIFIRGEYSRYLILEDYCNIKKIFPKAKISTIKKSNHCIHVENPIDFYKEINLFLKNKK